MKHKFLFSVFIIFFILIFIALGSWQIIRLNWKNNLIIEIENSLKNPPVELTQSNKENYLKIKTSGSIDFDNQIYLYNLNDSGTPGFEVIKPDNDIKENYWFSLNREDILKFTGKKFSKYIIYLDGNYQFPRPKKITANISNNHKKYAMTWFSLAISIFLLYLYFRKKNY